jgi:hypothetical protein
MKPLYWLIALLAGVALVTAWQLTRDETPAKAAAAEPASGLAPKSAAPVAASSIEEQAPPATDQVTRWIEDTHSAHAAQRVAAIHALAQAPRDQALPVLRRLVTNGVLEERPQALNSLRELALAQGDADGAIRGAIREVIYHGDDESLMAGAQDALDVVEESEMK